MEIQHARTSSSGSASSTSTPSPHKAAATRWRQKRLEVDATTLRQWKQQARLEITALLQDRESWYYKGRDADTVCALRSVYSSSGVRGYAESSQAPKRSAYFGEGVLNVTLEDVAYALYCDNSADQRTLATNVYRVNFLDGAVLDVFERKTPDDPFRFAGTKWVAYTLPPGLVAHPELVISEYFEFSCKTRDVDGHVVLVQYTMCPSFTPVAGGATVMRAHANQITTYRLVDDGTHCQTVGWFESGRSVPEWVVTKTLEQIFLNLSRLVGLADALAIARLGTASTRSTARACYLCNKKFGVLHKRRNCRACGESICAKCTIKLMMMRTETPVEASEFRLVLVDRPRDSGFQALKSLASKFCAPCVQKSREHRSRSVVALSDGSLSLSSEDGYVTTAPCSLDEGYEDVDSVLYGLRDSAAHGDSRRRGDRIASIAEPESPFDEDEVDDDGDNDSDEDEQWYDSNGLVKRTHSCPPQVGDPYVWVATQAVVAKPSADRSMRPRHTPMYAEPLDVNEKVPSSVLAVAQPQVQQQQPQHRQRSQQMPDAMAVSFNKLAQSIAAQEALLQSLQLERKKFYSRHRVPSNVSDMDDMNINSSNSNDGSNSSGAAASRFEVV